MWHTGLRLGSLELNRQRQTHKLLSFPSFASDSNEITAVIGSI